MLLGVVAELEAVARVDRARVRLLDATEDPQQRRLARAVEPEDDDARAADPEGGATFELGIKVRGVIDPPYAL